VKNKYRSNLEQKIAGLLKKKKLYFKYEEDKFGYILERNYITDFTVYVDKCRTFFIEVKGRLTQTDRAKYLAVKKCNPEIDLRFVFGYNNYLYKGSKTRYSDWCDKNGFKWCVLAIPEEWL